MDIEFIFLVRSLLNEKNISTIQIRLNSTIFLLMHNILAPTNERFILCLKYKINRKRDYVYV